MYLTLIKKHPLIMFIVLSYILSWSTWIIAALGETSSTFLTWIGGFGPAIAAIILTAVLEGRIGLTRLLSKIFVWKFNPILYLAAIGLPVFGTVAMIALYSLISRDLTPLLSLVNWLGILGKNSVVLLLTLLLGLVIVAGEEIGWRGYVLPKLRTKHSDLIASLGVGLIWGLWHLPNLWPFHPEQDALDLILFMSGILAISILYTWLYINSRESILLVSMFHSAYDVMVMFGSASLPFLHATRGYELLVLVIMASVIVASYGPRRFRSKFRDENMDRFEGDQAT
jgi:uncharacterized protein